MYQFHGFNKCVQDPKQCANNAVCLTIPQNALSRVRTSGIVKPNYNYNYNQYLERRNKTFVQNQFNYNRAPQYGDNVFAAQGAQLMNCSQFYLADAAVMTYKWLDGTPTSFVIPVAFGSPSVGLPASGGKTYHPRTILSSTNGGKTWSPSVLVQVGDFVYTSSMLTCGFIHDASYAVVGGQGGLLLYSFDGFRTWYPLANTSLQHDVHAVRMFNQLTDGSVLIVVILTGSDGSTQHLGGFVVSSMASFSSNFDPVMQQFPIPIVAGGTAWSTAFQTDYFSLRQMNVESGAIRT